MLVDGVCGCGPLRRDAIVRPGPDCTLSPGTEVETDGRIRWESAWRAPDTAEQVVLNVAAANDDFSTLGDFNYTLEKAKAGTARARNALRGPEKK